MSIWGKYIAIWKTDNNKNVVGREKVLVSRDPSKYTIIDTEIGLKDRKIHDIGAVRSDGAVFHKASKEEFFDFIEDTDYICGHNIVHHDAKYLFNEKACRWLLVDTLYVSPLLFPERPYHKLVKDDKLVSEQLNNPVNDCEKARDLLFDEISRWKSLPDEKQKMFASLLRGKEEFEGFLSMVGAEYLSEDVLPEVIKRLYAKKICQHADVETFINRYPCELAYALALIDTTDYRSITPGWVLRNFPEVEYIVKELRNKRCIEGCDYCNSQARCGTKSESFFRL